MNEPTGIRSILRATAILSSSSFLTILVGVATAKVNAVFLGPAGYGYMGLLQSLINLTVLVAGLGVGVGLVKMGASRAKENDAAGMACLRSAAWLVVAVTGVLATIVLVVFREKFSLWILNTPSHPWAVVLAGIGILFTVASNLQTNIINTYHRVEALAKNSAMAAILGAAVTIALIVVWRDKGIVPAIIAGAIVSWLISRYLLRKEIGAPSARPPLGEVIKAAKSLARFGGPYTASMLLGTGVQMALPILVVHMLDTQSVGYYRAAANISVTYLGFLITAMGQDYYPRVSAVSRQPEALRELINKQQRLVLLLAVPGMLGMLALVPYLIPLFYSAKFHPAIELLEWQLIGDLFKFSSWTMSFVILARCSSVTYFFTESVAGVAIFVTSWLGMRWFGLPGLGMSFLATYIIYYTIVWLIVRKEINFVWSSANKWMMAGAAAAALVVRLCPYTGMALWRTPVALTFAAVAGSGSLRAIWGEVKDTKTAAQAQRVVLGLLGRAQI